jgi:hypothetical protein
VPTFGTTPNEYDSVSALAVFDDGHGAALYVGGEFTGIGGVSANYIAKWDGSSWSALGTGMNSAVEALAVFDDGSGAALYVGGIFTSAGGLAANRIARWDGANWSSLGSAVTGGVHALTVHDDGSGPALYAAGEGAGQHNIAKWDGSNWTLLPGSNGVTFALTSFDDGTGPALYAGGNFTGVGPVPVNQIAKWNGSNWSTLGSGVTGGQGGSRVNALTVFDDGSGPALYVGGWFATAGGVAADGIAKWNGSSWSALGSEVGGPMSALAVFDDGTGSALYAGGGFWTRGPVPAKCIAKWSGSNWFTMGSALSGQVDALAVFDGGRGPALCVGGYFTSTPESVDSYIALWANPPGCGTPGLSMCEPGAASVIACPCANAPAGTGQGCNNSANTGGARLAATGIARLSYDSVIFTASGEQPTATSIVLQGDSSSSSGVVFGQGVRCVAGSLKRLYVKTAVAGSISAPQATDLHVHSRSAELGDPISPGTHRYYGVYYRDPNVLGGCPSSSTFNITQQLDVLWSM